MNQIRTLEGYGKSTLKATFVASIVIANITGSKLAWIPVLGVAVPAGFVAIGVAFLCTDLLGERYGKKAARRTVNASLAALVAAWALVYVSLALPTAPFYESSAAFESVMSQSGFIVTASILTFLVSQNVDVSVFHYLRDATDGQHKWLRNIGSTGVSQAVDTVLFIALAFGILPALFGGSPFFLAELVSITVGQYVVKLAVVAADTPLFYLLSR